MSKNALKIVIPLLLLCMFSTQCLAKTEELKVHEITKNIKVDNIEEYKNSIAQEIVLEEVNYKLKEIQETENKITLTKDKDIQEQQIVKTNDKYTVLNMFESEKQIEDDGYTGALELKNDSLNIEVNDSYIQKYKVKLVKEYNNVSQNELNDIPKTIEENGTEYYLVDPVWNVVQTQKIDGQEIPISYNGIMNYEGIKSRQVITNYIATVTYSGILEKEVTDSITYNLIYEEIPQETNYAPVVATTTAGIIIFSGIIIFKRKNTIIYNYQNQEWKIVKKCNVSKDNKLIDVTPLVPMTHKYKIKFNKKVFNELLGENITIKYFNQQFVYKIKEQEFEFFV